LLVKTARGSPTAFSRDGNTVFASVLFGNHVIIIPDSMLVSNAERNNFYMKN